MVSASFDIGAFKKGIEETTRGFSLYMEWAQPYQYMDNPMVIFTDSDEFKQQMLKIREKHLSKTMIIVIPKEHLWSFRLLPWIQKIINGPNYPKYHPNTVIAEYDCTMFAKTELVSYAAKKNFFSTSYISWIDIGYYRKILDRRKQFWLEVPPSFDTSKVAMNEIFHVDLVHTTPRKVFLRETVWVGGGLQLYTPDIAIRFHRQFQKALVRYMSQGLVNSDQQVILSMSLLGEREQFPLDVEVQGYYQTDDNASKLLYDRWFHLGLLMYHETPS